MVTGAQGASIAQRLDRLPLTWTLWRLAPVTRAGWGPVVATDAIAAYVIIPGALLPGPLLARFGIDQRAVPLETVTGV